MSVAFVIDMNLSIEWIDELVRRGWNAVHWSTVGDPRAPDAAIMQWARDHRRAVFKHDLDFGAMLALTHSAGPSVLQVRGNDVMPQRMGPIVAAAVQRYEADLEAGALVVVEETKSRVRILPL